MCGEYGGDVGARFGGQETAVSEGPEVAGVGFANGRFDARFPGVVGGKGEVPVAESCVEEAQVAGGGASGFHGVATFVGLRSDAESEALCGGWDELPDADGLFGGFGIGAESAFYESEPDEFCGYAFFAKDAFEVAAEGCEALQRGRPMRGTAALVEAQESVDGGVSRTSGGRRGGGRGDWGVLRGLCSLRAEQHFIEYAREVADAFGCVGRKGGEKGN